MKLERLGPFKLERILGRGGMGAVYVGLNVETSERAAVKVLNPVLADDVNFRERFKSEVETLKKLLHPNIVQLFGFGEQDDYLFYVMELVEGRSLQDELISGRRFNWREVARIGINVARALKHAHDRGVIHRDLKPANLLIDSHDHVKLTDFGIAKLYGGTNLTADGGVLGTADYMAPEQAEGKPVTGRCDLYSLGSVLYALLTGRPPFAGKSLPEVIQGLRFEKPIPLHRLNPDVPDEFESIVNQLLEKDPQKRIPTAVALAHRLKAMEHALSMETRIDLRDAEEDELPPDSAGADLPRTPPGVTGPLPIQTSLAASMRPTVPLPAAGDPPAESKLADAESAPGQRPPAPARSAPVTEARSATRSEWVEAAAAEAEPTEKKTVFTTVTKDELGARHAAAHDDEQPLIAWLKIGGLLATVLLLVAAFYYYATLPPNANAMYKRIHSAAQGGGEELVSVAPEMDRFLEIFPQDPRAPAVKQIQEEFELHQLQGRFDRRARWGGEPLSPIEQAYVQAVRQSATDAEGALARFQALVDVFSGSQQLGATPKEQRTAQQCLELARQRIERLSESIAANIAVEKELVASRLTAADELEETDAESARKIRQGVVTLYGNKEWARDLIERAQSKLDSGVAAE